MTVFGNKFGAVFITLAFIMANIAALPAQANASEAETEFQKAYIADQAGHFEEARVLYTEVCEKWGKGGCINLALMLNQGKGGPTEKASARQFLNKACDQEVARGCAHLAVMFYFGEGGSADKPAAISLLEKACILGEEKACALKQKWAP